LSILDSWIVYLEYIVNAYAVQGQE